MFQINRLLQADLLARLLANPGSDDFQTRSKLAAEAKTTVLYCGILESRHAAIRYRFFLPELASRRALRALRGPCTPNSLNFLPRA